MDDVEVKGTERGWVLAYRGTYLEGTSMRYGDPREATLYGEPGEAVSAWERAEVRYGEGEVSLMRLSVDWTVEGTGYDRPQHVVVEGEDFDRN